MARTKKNVIKNENELSFEDALAHLEEIIKQLEQGELPLEKSLDQFTYGVQLSQICLAKLTEAEDHIDKILEEHQGRLLEKPLQLQEANK